MKLLFDMILCFKKIILFNKGNGNNEHLAIWNGFDPTQYFHFIRRLSYQIEYTDVVAINIMPNL